MLSELPSFLSSDNLQTIAVVVIIGLLVLALVILKLVKALVMKVIGLAIIGGLVLGIYFYRDSLEECARTCSCTLLGQDVQVPDSATSICDQLGNS